MTLLETHDNPWRNPRRADDEAALCLLLEQAATAAFGVAARHLRARSRNSAPVAFARQAAMYLAHVALGLSYSEVGRLFRRDRTTAAYACQLVEDRRDDPDVDLRLQMLEDLCNDVVIRLVAPQVAQ
jgi:hypothetical protein